MEYKTMQLKADEAGKISGFFSTYEKTPDSYGDIIEPGAFEKTIEARKESGHPFPICFNHDFSSVIGSCEVRSEEKGPFMEGEFLDTQLAQDVRKMVKSGAIYQFSFAYDVLKRRDPNEEEVKAGVTNVLQEVEVFEISVVTVPANQNAIITDIKSYIEAVKSGRRNSKKDADAIREAISLLQGVLEDEEEPEQTEEVEAESNEASEETKSNGNSEKAAAILAKINSMKEVPDHDDEGTVDGEEV